MPDSRPLFLKVQKDVAHCGERESFTADCYEEGIRVPQEKNLHLLGYHIAHALSCNPAKENKAVVIINPRNHMLFAQCKPGRKKTTNQKRT